METLDKVYNRSRQTVRETRLINIPSQGHVTTVREHLAMALKRLSEVPPDAICSFDESIDQMTVFWDRAETNAEVRERIDAEIPKDVRSAMDRWRDAFRIIEQM